MSNYGYAGAEKIAELQSASKPLSPEQARVRAMKQGIDKQKLVLAQEHERQQNAIYSQKLQIKVSEIKPPTQKEVAMASCPIVKLPYLCNN